MKLLTIRDDLEGHLGVLLADEVLDIVSAAEALSYAVELPQSVQELIAGGRSARERVESLISEIQGGDEDQLLAFRDSAILTSYADTALLAPIPRPGFILSVGMNYRDHLAEMNTPVPNVPASFTKHPGSVVGPGEPIVLPPSHSGMVDYEGEICFVFGRECYNVEAEDAWDYVAGLTIANDVSARDWVAPIFEQETSMGAIHAWEVNVLGKQYPTFCPMGPLLATVDEVVDASNMRIRRRRDYGFTRRGRLRPATEGVHARRRCHRSGARWRWNLIEPGGCRRLNRAEIDLGTGFV
jgi:2-keto-4-pentenoate hydratase/2-oxohepta-3-ene-1,7-dioic acid hydratase in catechol pathway